MNSEIEALPTNLSLMQSLSNICRICMSFGSDMIDMFDSVLELFEGEWKFVYKAFEDITGILLSENERLSRFLCKSCASRLKDSVLLRFQAKQANQQLIEHVNLVANSSSAILKDQESEVQIKVEQNEIEQEFADNSANLTLNTSEEILKTIAVTKTNKTTSNSMEQVSQSNTTKPDRCKYCEKTFNSLDSSVKHTCHANTKLNMYSCHICSRTFSNPNICKDHIRAHLKHTTYLCHICSKPFKTSEALRAHSYVHSFKEFSCHICFKKFSDSKVYRDHIRTHLQESPHICEICSKSFSSSSNLKFHLRNHNTENSCIKE